MTSHNLDKLFNPSGIAVIGASERVGSVGRKVIYNLIQSKFAKGLYPINPKYKTVFDLTCYDTVNVVPGEIDLAVITTPAATVPNIMQSCGEKGIRAVIIISAGFSEMGKAGKKLEDEINRIAKKYRIHFIGPNCLGVMRPAANVNASFDNNYATPGSIALLSQSGAICAAILDWAMNKGIGFSTIVSMGNSIDLDFGDMLEYLADDPLTKSILLYIEGVHFPKRFIDGLRKAASKKPVIAIKAGRHASGIRAVHSHTGALVGDDDVFSAVLERAGALRVESIEDLFTAAGILFTSYRAKGNRLTIITNGGGGGVMAADRAADLNLNLPELSPTTLAALNEFLPNEWSHQNPIDIIGDATPDRYRRVIDICLNDETSDGILTILVPVAMSEPLAVAKEICAFKENINKPLIACWMGGRQSEESRDYFSAHHIPCYSTPEVAVDAFSYLARYEQNQQLLAQTPKSKTTKNHYDLDAVNKIINTARNENRTLLTMMEAKQVLAAFSIPVAETIIALDANAAKIAADKVGFPVVMKINSPDITHKQDVGGVVLNIVDQTQLQKAFHDMMKQIKQLQPNAKINGVTIEPMYERGNFRELMIGVLHDKVFGSVITFGMGGSLVEVIHDRAIGLPPLNEFLAKQMIAKTRAAKLLGEFRGKPPADQSLLIDILLRISDLVRAFPAIQEMDINPLLLDEKQAFVVDARFVISETATKSANVFEPAELSQQSS